MAQNRGLGLTIKGLVVGGLILLLLIPAMLVSNLIRERAERQQEVIDEVSSKWAEDQTILGPVLVIPYWSHETDEIADAKTGVIRKIEKQVKRLCYVLPEELRVDGELIPQTRKRSIFKITVYQAALDIRGKFAPVDFEELDIKPEDLVAEQAQVCFGLSDFRGLEEQINVELDGQSLKLIPNMVRNELIETGLAANLKLDPKAGHDFSMKLNIRGSEQFYITPVGARTDVTLRSTYANPSFIGNFLPNTPAGITEAGFTAEWSILNLNRSYPQSWKDDSQSVYESYFGVELLQPTDTYTKTTKAVKYALLFIALTFVLYFLLEILQKRNVHPMQYVLVGLALCLFYTLLLSISEYTGFNWAYLIASAATIGLITWYSNTIFRKWSVAVLLAVGLALLYCFIFVLLQLQDGALLFGSIGLFVLLAAIMYYSRKVDWQNEDAGEPDKQ
ncbi:MAG: cell envelope integrity protein CreD [Rikenellaceae bacterium]|jgi:inner membrane protein|nr:cell envelope integrity protein CreD [Rikenellaceae bacterium]